jgi:hypothetical protein
MIQAPRPEVIWPDGKRFAVAIVDDTDSATMDNVPVVYRLLRDLGIRSTKTVWPLGGTRPPSGPTGTTCDDPSYLAWVKELAREGFEIGLHNVTYHSSHRDEVRRGLDRFRELFGHHPRSHANHAECEDGIYWGAARLTGLRRPIYQLTTMLRNRRYFGHVAGSPYFWGDLCRDHISYVRNFTFADVNTLKLCPFMPYHDPQRPLVRAWYAAAEGGTVPQFNNTLREEAQDRLLAEGGACIVYTHFGKSFVQHGTINPRFAQLMTRLAKLGGWMVPVTTLLDHIAQQRGGVHQLTDGERARLEWRWLAHKVVLPQS